jgi:hypothetical protein
MYPCRAVSALMARTFMVAGGALISPVSTCGTGTPRSLLTRSRCAAIVTRCAIGIGLWPAGTSMRPALASLIAPQNRPATAGLSFGKGFGRGTKPYSFPGRRLSLFVGGGATRGDEGSRHGPPVPRPAAGRGRCRCSRRAGACDASSLHAVGRRAFRISKAIRADSLFDRREPPSHARFGQDGFGEAVWGSMIGIEVVGSGLTRSPPVSSEPRPSAQTQFAARGCDRGFVAENLPFSLHHSRLLSGVMGRLDGANALRCWT